MTLKKLPIGILTFSEIREDGLVEAILIKHRPAVEACCHALKTFKVGALFECLHTVSMNQGH